MVQHPLRRALQGCFWLVATALALSAVCMADKGQNAGIFRDRAGQAHTWVIHRSHLLEWDEKPYAPAGLVFRSAYLQNPTPETLQKDLAELDQLKGAGILDIWVEPQRGLLENTQEQIQTLLDALEQRGFRYGLRVGDRGAGPLVGFSPTVAAVHVPLSRMQPATRQNWSVVLPDRARRAVYTLTDNSLDGKSQSWAIAAGEVTAERGRSEIEVALRNSPLIGRTPGLLHVVPEVAIPREDLGSFGDLWEGMQTYADRLKQRLLALKFGPGLRFLLDPFSAGDGSVGQEDLVFPSSVAFRTAFGEWLARRYGIGTTNLNWQMTDRRFTTKEVAARLIPLWPRNDPPPGDGWLLDPEEKVAYRCIARNSTIWSDLDAFRAVTLKRWMNTLTNTLKSEGLNIPMLFTWGAYHPIFSNTPSPTGYDGLGAQLHGRPADIGRDAAAYAMAQAEEADRNTWLLATRLGGPLDPSGQPHPLGGMDVRTMWTAVREAGFRGAYLDPAQVSGAASQVRELSAAIQGDLPRLVQDVPQVCFFPLALASADRVTRLPNGAWWVPSGGASRLITLGDTIRAYEIAAPLGTDHPARTGLVIWSTRGPQEVTCFLQNPAALTLYDSAGKPVKFEKKKYEVRFRITEEPVVAAGMTAAALFPLELAVERLREFDALLRAAEAQRLESASLRGVYDEARKNLDAGSAGIVTQSVQPYIQQLRMQLYPYVWIEGERSANHTFPNLAFQAGCSTGAYLRLDRADRPPSGLFRATYTAELVRDGTYELWVAGRLPGSPGVSPIYWQVDDEPPVPLKQATPVGPEYALGMAWFQLGQVALKAGRHELMVAVAERAAGPGGRYTAGLDAVVFSRPGFQPKGIEKPNPLVTLAPPVDERRGSGKGKKQPDRAEPRERGKADRNESRDREKPTSGSPMR